MRLYKDKPNKDEIIITETAVSASGEFGNTDINEGMEIAKACNDGSLPREKMNRFALQRLYKKYGKEKTIEIFRYAVSIRNLAYAPTVHNFLDLEQKWSNLATYTMRKSQEKQNERGVTDARNVN
jgi:hypothetical protein